MNIYISVYECAKKYQFHWDKSNKVGHGGVISVRKGSFLHDKRGFFTFTSPIVNCIWPFLRSWSPKQAPERLSNVFSDDVEASSAFVFHFIYIYLYILERNNTILSIYTHTRKKNETLSFPNNLISIPNCSSFCNRAHLFCSPSWNKLTHPWHILHFVSFFSGLKQETDFALFLCECDLELPSYIFHIEILVLRNQPSFYYISHILLSTYVYIYRRVASL